MSVVNRPETGFDGPSHTYTKLDGEKLLGVSSIAKVGEAEDSFSIGSAWGFRLGYEGALEIAQGCVDDTELGMSPEAMRAELQKRGLTPWGTRDKAAARGNWAHDLLEALATDGTTPTADLLNTMDEEHRGHGRAILQWYVDYRPSFVATEVQVTSLEHGFAGRYDIRCQIQSLIMSQLMDLPEDFPVEMLGLVDLKTSKRIYPTSHFPQLEGYEVASVEMGFPATDFRAVLNTHPDGTYDFKLSYANGEDFLAYLRALQAIKRIKALDPEVVAKRASEQILLALLPGWSRDLAGKPGVPDTAQDVGRLLGGLRKRGLVTQGEDKVWHQVS